MPKPSERQSKFLEARGISVPPTKAAASTLIGYIKNGNFAGKAQTEADRIAALRSAQNNYMGKNVRHRLHGWAGVVKYILAKNAEQMGLCRDVGEDLSNKSPFRAYVDWGENGTSQTTLGNVELL